MSEKTGKGTKELVTDQEAENSVNQGHLPKCLGTGTLETTRHPGQFFWSLKMTDTKQLKLRPKRHMIHLPGRQYSTSKPKRLAKRTAGLPNPC